MFKWLLFFLVPNLWNALSALSFPDSGQEILIQEIYTAKV